MTIEYEGKPVTQDMVVRGKFGPREIVKWVVRGQAPLSHANLHPSPNRDNVVTVYRGDFGVVRSLNDHMINQDPDCQKLGIHHTR